jgi:hypothetical protein
LEDEVRGIVCFILNSAALIFLLGFLSSKRHNLDEDAVKHVAMSFRFAIVFALLVLWIVLDARRAYLVATGANVFSYQTRLWSVPAIFVFCVFYLLFMLLDCIPQLPALAQILVTVRACCPVCTRFNFIIIVFFSCVC